MSTSTYGSKSTPFSLRVMRSVFGVLDRLSSDLAGRVALEVFCIPLKRSKADFSGVGLGAPVVEDVPFRGGTLRTYAWGSGPTVLGVHGWESSAGRFTKFIEPLVEAGFRVVLIDGHAHGASSGRQTNAILYGDGTRAVIQHLGEVYAVIGHSFGGATTVAMLNRYPQVEVERLVLVASVTFVQEAFQMFARIVHLSDAAYRAMLHHIEQYARASIRSFDVDHIGRSRTEPLLIVHDTKDNITSFSGAEAVAAAWPGAEFYQTDGLGHRRIMKDTGVIERVVAFLGEDA